eukprot:766577-Hanusia_phi.AAC.10
MSGGGGGEASPGGGAEAFYLDNKVSRYDLSDPDPPTSVALTVPAPSSSSEMPRAWCQSLVSRSDD